MQIGVDYYPEHWDRKLWEQDADLMKQAGVDIVRMGEFAWCKLEPADGEFDFEWLDYAMDLFAARDIKVVLGTPTSCPPLWFYEKYPESIQTGKDGNKIATGIRGHRCYNNPDFNRYASRIVDEMTRHYAGYKNLIAWQIDNELEANFCFCENCTARFREWLKDKYGTLNAVNEAYGNNVWSGEYSSWEQITPPYGTYPQAWLNPSYMLDFNRYASDSMIEYMNNQVHIIRKNCPEMTITTNIWFCENMPDFYKTFENLDFVSYDNYPVSRIPSDKEACYSHVFHLDMMRGIKRKNFWIMEQLSGGMGCWMPMQHMPLPGMIKGYSLQAFAHGADSVLHFRWRTAVSGAEMHWHGLIDHSNVPGRRFSEFQELCREAKKLKALENTYIKSEVAILYSSDNEYAFKIQPQTQGMYYLEQLMLFHSGFTKCGVNIDIIGQHDDISDYKIIVAPEMYVTDMDVVKRLYEFARNGGTVIITNRSGVKDEYNKCIMEQLPTVLKEMTGSHVKEYDPMGEDKLSVKMQNGITYQCGRWCDILEEGTSEVVGRYEGGFFDGEGAITCNSYGSGTVYYVGTVLEKAFYADFAEDILIKSGIEYIHDLPDNVEVTTRTDGEKTYSLIFNNTDVPQKIVFGGAKADMELKPFEFVCL
ncbi:MAG: beta-galactosidase [Lachnospiraceae bacterium]|nr:beta-galactosidase [Candidatus Merdinaster equi]